MFHLVGVQIPDLAGVGDRAEGIAQGHVVWGVVSADDGSNAGDKNFQFGIGAQIRADGLIIRWECVGDHDNHCGERFRSLGDDFLQRGQQVGAFRIVSVVFEEGEILSDFHRVKAEGTHGARRALYNASAGELHDGGLDGAD